MGREAVLRWVEGVRELDLGAEFERFLRVGWRFDLGVVDRDL